MTLEDAIRDLDSLDNSLTICAARMPKWTRMSEAVLCPATQAHVCRLPYCLEVSVAKDVLEAWSFMRDGRVPNLAEKCEAIIHYAENDAYLLPE